MKMDNNINWDKLESDAQATTSVSKYDTPQRTIFLKVKQGIHKLRILPTGNKLDGVPYMRLNQHILRVPAEGGRPIPNFILCWNFMIENLNSKETVEEKKNNSILSYLSRAQKMSQEDMAKYQEFGCPACKAFAHLDMHGAEKEVKNGLYPRDQWIWNVIWRQTQYSGDGTIYVLGVSKTHFNTIVNAIKQDRAGGHYTLDPDKGFDLSYTATGEGIGLGGRKYAVMFDRNPSPLNMKQGDIPFDLAEVMANSYRPYQELVNAMKQTFGAALRQYGYIIPGDIAMQQVYAPSTAGQVPTVLVPQVQQFTNEMIPQPVRIEKPGGYYEIDGTLYDPSGKKLF